jgi:hypothetical protein
MASWLQAKLTSILAHICRSKAAMTAQIWFNVVFKGAYAHMEYEGVHFCVDWEAVLKSQYRNEGFWSSMYAGRILKNTRAAAYKDIEDLRMKIMRRPLEDLYGPTLYVEVSSRLGRLETSEYREKTYRQVLTCFYLCAIARMEKRMADSVREPKARL